MVSKWCRILSIHSIISDAPSALFQGMGSHQHLNRFEWSGLRAIPVGTSKLILVGTALARFG